MSGRDELGRLEEALDQHLPRPRLVGRPSPDLLAAARAWSEQVWRLEQAGLALESDPALLSSREIEAGVDLLARPVFVCGMHRSGTTLLRDLLDGHPSLCVLPSEGSFLTSLRPRLAARPADEWPQILGCEWLRRLANPINQPPYWLLGRSSATASPYLRFTRRLKAWWPEVEQHFDRCELWPHLVIVLAFADLDSDVGPGKGAAKESRRWVDKTPGLEHHLESLFRQLPASRVIQLVRHPVAVYASYQRRIELATGKRASPRKIVAEIVASLRLAAAARQRLGKEQYRVVRYEDLVEEPATTLNEVAQFLDIRATAELHRPTVVGRPSSANSSYGPAAQAGVIEQRQRCDPRDQLTTGELRRLRWQAGSVAEAFGYDLE